MPVCVVHAAGSLVLLVLCAAANAGWGAMLNDARPGLQTAPRLLLLPGLAIFVEVLGFNLLGDALRDLLDPRIRRPGG